MCCVIKKVPIIKIKVNDPQQIEFNWSFNATFWRNFLKRKLKHCFEKVCNTDIFDSHKTKPKVYKNLKMPEIRHMVKSPHAPDVSSSKIPWKEACKSPAEAVPPWGVLWKGCSVKTFVKSAGNNCNWVLLKVNFQTNNQHPYGNKDCTFSLLNFAKSFWKNFKRNTCEGLLLQGYQTTGWIKKTELTARSHLFSWVNCRW